jgi:hypothetical protein
VAACPEDVVTLVAHEPPLIPVLSDRSWAISSFRPDVDALAAAPARVIIAVGEESQSRFTGRTSVAKILDDDN